MRQAFLVIAVAVLMTMAVAAVASASCNTCAIGMGVCGNGACAAPAQTFPACAQPTCAPVAVAPTCAPVAVAPTCNTCAVAVAPPICTTCAPAPQVMGYCAQPAGPCAPMPAQKWHANLANVAAPCPTGASGGADFQLAGQGDVLRYWVNVNNIASVTSAEIRLVTAGCDLANAPVVATLFSGPGPSNCVSGRLSRGNLSPCDLKGPLQGQSLSALLIALTNGTAVVTVDTCQHPGGEIAGLAGCAGRAPC